MLNFLFVVMMHLLPLILLLIPFLLLFDVSLKKNKKEEKKCDKIEPNVNELEEKLNHLIQNNQKRVKFDNLHKELKNTSTQNISAYINLNKKDLKGFHLFQIIFSLIKNKSEDEKIIRILRHYLPTVATTHLYAMLNSYKVFFKISKEDGVQKELMVGLNSNNVRGTLIYLENKIQGKLKEATMVEPSLQQMVINDAVIYGLVFASFAEFYDNDATVKILRLCNELSPELFKYWHTIPKYCKDYVVLNDKYRLN